MVILRGVTKAGNEVFYTGRAGEYWVSPEREDAFTWGSTEGAQNRAKTFNRTVDLHGVWFVAITVWHCAGCGQLGKNGETRETFDARHDCPNAPRFEPGPGLEEEGETRSVLAE